jgi:hypothetical protein
LRVATHQQRARGWNFQVQRPETPEIHQSQRTQHNPCVAGNPHRGKRKVMPARSKRGNQRSVMALGLAKGPPRSPRIACGITPAARRAWRRVPRGWFCRGARSARRG